MDDSSQSTVQASPTFTIGSIVFKRYKILEYISSGAAGRVFKALDVELDIVVALKVLISDSHTDRELVRFQSEARLASRLKHPNVATIYDFGLFGTTPYLSMEYVEGETLQNILKTAGRLQLEEALDVFIPVCRALVHAHTNNVVHRDIKPANIVIAIKSDESSTAKILDFGVSKKINLDLSSTEGKVTPTGGFVGSPAFMSPEQARGETVTAKSDGYSFGCLIWTCLVGEPPILGDNLLETLARLQTETPPSLQTVCLSAPVGIVEITDRLLSKDPAQRPDLQKDVLPLLEMLDDDLHSCKDNASESECPDKSSPFALKEAHSTTPVTLIWVGVVGVALLLLSGGIFQWSSSRREKTPSLSLSPTPLLDVELKPEQLEKCDTTEQKYRRIAELKKTLNEAKIDDYPKIVRCLEELLPFIPDNSEALSGHFRLANNYQVMLKYDKAMAEYRKSLALAEKLNSPVTKIAILDEMNGLRLWKYQANKSQIPRQLFDSFDQANALAEKVLPPRSQEMTNRCLLTAERYRQMGKNEDAAKWYRRVKHLYKVRNLNPADPGWTSLAQYYLQYADFLSGECKYAQAEEQFQTGIKTFRSAKIIPDSHHVVIVRGYIDYGRVLIQLGRPLDALNANDEALLYIKGKPGESILFKLLQSQRVGILADVERFERQHAK